MLRAATILVVFWLASAVSQTTLYDGFGTWQIVNCGVTQFTLPTTMSNQYAKIDVQSVSNLQANEYISVYTRYNNQPNFVTYDTMQTCTSSPCPLFYTPCTTTTTGTLNVAVFTSFKSGSGNITVAATLSHAANEPTFSISDGVAQNVSIRQGGDSFFRYTLPPHNFTGEIEVTLHAYDYNWAMNLNMAAHTGMTNSRKCPRDFTVSTNKFHALDAWTTSSTNRDNIFHISACDWLSISAGGSTFSFAIALDDTATLNTLPIYNYTITAKMIHGSPVLPVPYSNGMLGVASEPIYHNFEAPAAADFVTVRVTGLEVGTSGAISKVNYNGTVHEQNTISLSSNFANMMETNSHCGPFALATFDSTAGQIMSQTFKNTLDTLKIRDETWGVKLDFNNANHANALFNSFPISYTIDVISAVATPTWLSNGVPTPAIFPYGYDYVHFAFSVTQADVDAQSTLIVAMYQDATFTRHNFAAFVNPYGYAGQSSTGLNYLARCQPRKSSERGSCTIVVEPCLLGVGTWYISVMPYNYATATSVVPLGTAFDNTVPGWAEQDVPFTITARLETPTPLTNGTMTLTSQPAFMELQNYYRQFTFNVAPGDLAIRRKLRIEAAHGDDSTTSSVTVQYAALAGDPANTMCGSQLLSSAATFTSLLTTIDVTTANNRPLVPGTYYIGVRLSTTSYNIGLLYMRVSLVPIDQLTASMSPLSNGVPQPDTVPANWFKYYTFDTYAAAAGDTLVVEVVQAGTTDPTYNIGLTVYNDSVTTTTQGVYTHSTGANRFVARVAISPCDLDLSTYFIRIAGSASASIDYIVTVWLQPPTYVALPIGTPYVQPYVPGFAPTQMSLAIPADMSPTSNLEVTIYTNRADSTSFQVFSKAWAPAGADKCYQGSVQQCSFGSGVAACHLQFAACELPRGGNLYLGLDSSVFLDGDARDPLLVTFNASFVTPMPLTLGVGHRDVLDVSRAGQRTLSRHYSVAIPATMTPGALLEFRLSSLTSNALGEAAGTVRKFEMYVTNSIDNPGQLAGPTLWSWQLLSKVSGRDSTYSDRSFECCRSTSPDYARLKVAQSANNFGTITLDPVDVRLGATYYIAVASDQYVSRTPDAFVISAYIKEPSATIALTNGVAMPASANRWMPTIFTLTAPSATAESHFTVTVTDSASSTGTSVAYVNVGSAATETLFMVSMRSYGSGQTSVVQVPNCAGSSTVYVAVYMKPQSTQETTTDFTIKITHDPIIVLTTAVSPVVTIHQENTPNDYFRPRAYFKYDASSLAMMSSFDLKTEVYDWLNSGYQIEIPYLSTSGTAGYGPAACGSDCIYIPWGNIGNATNTVVDTPSSGNRCNYPAKLGWFYFTAEPRYGSSGTDNVVFTLQIVNVVQPTVVTGSSSALTGITLTANFLMSYTVPAGAPTQGSSVTLTFTNADNIIQYYAWRNGDTCHNVQSTPASVAALAYTCFGYADTSCETALSGTTYNVLLMSPTTASATVALSYTVPSLLTVGQVASGSNVIGLWSTFIIPVPALADNEYFSVEFTTFPYCYFSGVDDGYCGSSFNSVTNTSLASTSLSSYNQLIFTDLPNVVAYAAGDSSGPNTYTVAPKKYTFNVAAIVDSGSFGDFTPSYPGNIHYFDIPAGAMFALNISRPAGQIGSLEATLINEMGDTCIQSLTPGQTYLMDMSSYDSAWCPRGGPVRYKLLVIAALGGTASYTVRPYYSTAVATVGTLNTFSIPPFFNRFSFYVPAAQINLNDLWYQVNSTSIGNDITVYTDVDRVPSEYYFPYCFQNQDPASPVMSRGDIGYSAIASTGFYFTVYNDVPQMDAKTFTFLAKTASITVLPYNTTTSGARALNKDDTDLYMMESAERQPGSYLRVTIKFGCGALDVGIGNELYSGAISPRYHTYSTIPSSAATIDADGYMRETITFPLCLDHPAKDVFISIHSNWAAPVPYSIIAEYISVPFDILTVGVPVTLTSPTAYKVFAVPYTNPENRRLNVYFPNAFYVNYDVPFAYSPWIPDAPAYQCTPGCAQQVGAGGSLLVRYCGSGKQDSGLVFITTYGSGTLLVSNELTLPSWSASLLTWSGYSDRQIVPLYASTPILDRVEKSRSVQYGLDVPQYTGAVLMFTLTTATVLSSAPGLTIQLGPGSLATYNLRLNPITQTYYATFSVNVYELGSVRQLVLTISGTDDFVDFTVQYDVINFGNATAGVAAHPWIVTIATPTATAPETVVCDQATGMQPHFYTMAMPTGLTANQQLRFAVRVNSGSSFWRNPSGGNPPASDAHSGIVKARVYLDGQRYADCSYSVTDCAMVIEPSTPDFEFAQTMEIVIEGVNSETRMYTLTLAIETFDVPELVPGVWVLLPAPGAARPLTAQASATETLNSGEVLENRRFTYTINATVINYDIEFLVSETQSGGTPTWNFQSGRGYAPSNFHTFAGPTLSYGNMMGADSYHRTSMSTYSWDFSSFITRVGTYGGVVSQMRPTSLPAITMWARLTTLETTPQTTLVVDAAAIAGVTDDNHGGTSYTFVVPEGGVTLEVTGYEVTVQAGWSPNVLNFHTLASNSVGKFQRLFDASFVGETVVVVVSSYSGSGTTYIPFTIAIVSVDNNSYLTGSIGTPVMVDIRDYCNSQWIQFPVTTNDVGKSLFVSISGLTQEAEVYIFNQDQNCVDFVSDTDTSILVFVTAYCQVNRICWSNFSLTLHAVAAVTVYDGVVQTATLSSGGIIAFAIAPAQAVNFEISQDFPTALVVEQRVGSFTNPTNLVQYISRWGDDRRAPTSIRGSATQQDWQYVLFKVPHQNVDDGFTSFPTRGYSWWNPPTWNTTLTVTARTGASLAATVSSDFCGARYNVFPYDNNATALNARAVATFESIYRVAACGISRTNNAILPCMPLTAACNASLWEYSCMATYKESFDGYAVDPCSSFCQNALRDCFPLQQLPGTWSGLKPNTGVHVDIGWCLPASVAQCGGGDRSVPAAAVAEAPPAAVVNVGLVVGIVLGVFFFLVIIGIIVFLVMRQKKNNKVAVANDVKVEKSMPESKPESKPETPAPDSKAD